MQLTALADRIRAGADPLAEARDWLDAAARGSAAEVLDLIDAEPSLTGNPRADALLGALAEHTATERGLPVPAWTVGVDRFLDQFWFVSDVPGFRAIALAQTPMALKRRCIFWPARSLVRV